MPYQMVRKANSLIEATYKLSAIEQKIVLYLVSTITLSDEDFKPYQFKIKKFFERIMDLDKKSLDKLQAYLDGMEGK